jgi:hypothetical protein
MNQSDAVQRGIDAEPQTVQSAHKHRCLAWAGQYAGDWEILAYCEESSWEACFFNRNLQHEHVRGSSFEDARIKAEQRIDFIESERLASQQLVLLSRKMKRRPSRRAARAEISPAPNRASDLAASVPPLVVERSKADSFMAQPWHQKVRSSPR